MRRLAFALVACSIAVSAMAQSPAMKPFEINMDRVKVAKFGGDFSLSNTYLIPTVNLYVSAQGSVWAKKGGAKAHGKYFVDGLSKALLQDLAKKIQDDLVTRMRAAGYTVLTYDDVKGDPDVAGRSLQSIDAKLGLPSSGGFGLPITYVLATPSDAQAFSNPIQGGAWPYRGMSKAKNLVVMVPELKFTVPQMFGETESGYNRDSAGISTNPAMVFEGGTVTGMNPKGGQPSIQVQRHGQRPAAEVAGTIKKISEDKTHFNASWETTSNDWVMTLDATAFVDGILRVGYGFNAMVVAEVVKEHH